jgi:hypothetical protein
MAPINAKREQLFDNFSFKVEFDGKYMLVKNLPEAKGVTT